MYKLVIPTAGLGARIGPYTKFKNKALVTVGDKPAIAHVIDSFPNAEEVVVLIGYEGEAVKDSLELLYPNKKFRFVKVTPFEGEGSGLGVTLNHAKEWLQCPFIFSPNDTIIRDLAPEDPSLVGSWLVYYKKKIGDSYKVEDYRTISYGDGIVTHIHSKGSGTDLLYTGVCGVADYEAFWDAMSAPAASSAGEVVGLSSIDVVKAVEVKEWFDCGSLNSLQNTKRVFSSGSDYEILEKEDEAIWFMNERVVKFSRSKSFIYDRAERTKYFPDGVLPELLGIRTYGYSYNKIDGAIFTKQVSRENVLNLLEWISENLWCQKPDSDGLHSGDYSSILDEFYRSKTYQRVELYHTKFEFLDREIVINGVNTPRIIDLLDDVDWNDLALKSDIGRFHGDFHCENILIDKNGFRLLDWRQNFGKNNYEFGDIYYDLAKFMHGFIVSHPIVNKSLFSVRWLTEHSVNIDIYSSMMLREGRNAFEDWLISNDYSVEQVMLLTGLIFVNIAPLHEQPYSEFLYLLGKYILSGGDA